MSPIGTQWTRRLPQELPENGQSHEIRPSRLAKRQFMKPSQRRRKRWIEASLSEARALRYLENGLISNLSVHVSSKLLRAARQQAGVRSDTKLLLIALSMLAVREAFGERLPKRRGSIDPSTKLDY